MSTRSKTSSRSPALNIVINAKDEASSVLKKTSQAATDLEKQVGSLNKTSAAATEAMANFAKGMDRARTGAISLGTAIAGIGVAIAGLKVGIGTINGIATGIQSVQTIASQPLIAGFFSQIIQGAIKSTQSVARLSDILGATSDLAGNLTGSVAKGLFVGSGSFQLDSKLFKSIEERTEESFRKGFRESLKKVGKNIGKSLFGKVQTQQSGFFAGEDFKFLKENLPKAFSEGGIGKIIGRNLSQAVSSALQSRLKDSAKKLFTQGNFKDLVDTTKLTQQALNVSQKGLFKSIEDGIVGATSRAYIKGFKFAEKNAVTYAKRTGAAIMAPFAATFGILSTVLLPKSIRRGIEDGLENSRQAVSKFGIQFRRVIGREKPGESLVATNLQDLLKDALQPAIKKSARSISDALFQDIGKTTADALLDANAGRGITKAELEELSTRKKAQDQALKNEREAFKERDRALTAYNRAVEGVQQARAAQADPYASVQGQLALLVRRQTQKVSAPLRNVESALASPIGFAQNKVAGAVQSQISNLGIDPSLVQNLLNSPQAATDVRKMAQGQLKRVDQNLSQSITDEISQGLLGARDLTQNIQSAINKPISNFSNGLNNASASIKNLQNTVNVPISNFSGQLAQAGNAISQAQATFNPSVTAFSSGLIAAGVGISSAGQTLNIPVTSFSQTLVQTGVRVNSFQQILNNSATQTSVALGNFSNGINQTQARLNQPVNTFANQLINAGNGVNSIQQTLNKPIDDFADGLLAARRGLAQIDQKGIVASTVGFAQQQNLIPQSVQSFAQGIATQGLSVEQQINSSVSNISSGLNAANQTIASVNQRGLFGSIGDFLQNQGVSSPIQESKLFDQLFNLAVSSQQDRIENLIAKTQSNLVRQTLRSKGGIAGMAANIPGVSDLIAKGAGSYFDATPENLVELIKSPTAGLSGILQDPGKLDEFLKNYGKAKFGDRAEEIENFTKSVERLLVGDLDANLTKAITEQDAALSRLTEANKNLGSSVEDARKAESAYQDLQSGLQLDATPLEEVRRLKQERISASKAERKDRAERTKALRQYRIAVRETAAAEAQFGKQSAQFLAATQKQSLALAELTARNKQLAGTFKTLKSARESYSRAYETRELNKLEQLQFGMEKGNRAAMLQNTVDFLGETALRTAGNALIDAIVPNIPVPSFVNEILNEFATDKQLRGWFEDKVEQMEDGIAKLIETPTETVVKNFAQVANQGLLKSINDIGNKIPPQIKRKFADPIIDSFRSTNAIIEGLLLDTLASITNFGVKAATGGVTDLGGLAGGILTTLIKGDDMEEYLSSRFGGVGGNFTLNDIREQFGNFFAKTFLGTDFDGLAGGLAAAGRTDPNALGPERVTRAGKGFIASQATKALGGDEALAEQVGKIVKGDMGAIAEVVGRTALNVSGAGLVAELLFGPTGKDDGSGTAAAKKLVMEVGRTIVDGIKAVFEAANFVKEIVAKFLEIDEIFDGLFTESISRIIIKINTDLAAQTAEAIASPFQNAFAQVIDLTDEMIREVTTQLEEVPNTLKDVAGALAQPFGYFSGVTEPLEILQGMQGAVEGFSNWVNEASQNIFFFSSAIDSLRGLVLGGPYQMLITQNVELQQQILKTQASLVATNKIMKDGAKIENPASAILALQAPVQSVLREIQRDSLQLVGVTSSALTEIFNTVASQASIANVSLREAGKLTIDFAAALGTTGMPLDQAAQEIRSIFQGEITSDSEIATFLGLQNDQIKKLIQQGKLYDFLREKLKAFTAGNALAAQTINGIGSNIQDVFEILTREAGKPLIDPIVEQMNRLYTALSENQPQIQAVLGNIIERVKEIGLSAVRIAEVIWQRFGGIFVEVQKYLFKEAAAGAKSVAEAFQFVMSVFSPFIGLLQEIIQFAATNLAGWPIKIFLVLKLIETTIGGLQKSFKLLLSLIPGVGQAMWAWNNIRFNNMISQFVNIRKQLNAMRAGFGTTGSAALIVAQNLDKIPGAADQIADKFPVIGGAIAGMIPQAANMVVVLIGLRKNFGIVGTAMDAFGDTLTGYLLPSLKAFGESKGLVGIPKLVDEMEGKLGEIAEEGGLLAFAEKRINAEKDEFIKGMKQKILTTGLYTIAIAAAGIAIYEYFKRMKDAGDGIRKLAEESRKGAELIASTWDETRMAMEKPIDVDKLPASDWIDTIIIKTNQWNKGTLEVKNVVDVLYVGLAGIVNFGHAIVKVIQGIVTVFTQMIWMAGDLANLVLKFVSRDQEGVKKVLADLDADYQAFDEQMKEIFGGLDSFTITPKVEEEYNEIVAAINSGELQKAVAAEVAAVDKLIAEVPNSGSVFKEQFDPIKESLKGLAEGTVPLQKVKDQIASLPDAIPESRKKAILDLLEKQFPNGVNQASDAAKDLASVIQKIDVKKLFPLDEVLEGLAAGTKTNDDVIAEMTKLKEVLPTDQFNDLVDALYKASGTKEGMGGAFQSAQDLTNGMTALNQALDVAQADSANIRLELLRKRIDDAISGQEQQLKVLEDMGQGYSSHAIEIRTMIAQYEKAREKLAEFSESVDIVADPIKKLEQFIANANGEIDKLTAALETTSQNAIAGLNEQLAEQNISQGFFDEQTWKKNNDMLSAQLQSTKDRLTEAYRRYNKLGEDEKERAKEVAAQINELSKRYSALRIQQAESDLERYKKSIENQIAAVRGALLEGKIEKSDALQQQSDIQLRENEKQLNLAKADLKKLAESDKAGREAINAEIVRLMDERNEIIKNRDAEVIDNLDRELQRGIDLIRQSESERQIEARGTEGYRSDEDAVKQIQSEISTIEADINRVQQLRSTLEGQTPLNDPALEEERLDRIQQLRQEELDLTLQGLDKEKEAWEQQTEVIINNITQRQNENLRAIQAQINAGKALEEERGVVDSRSKLEELAVELERTSDVQKQAQLLLQIEEERANLQGSQRNLAIKEIEIENTKELTGLTEKLLKGEITRVEIQRENAEQNLKRIESEIRLTTNKAELVALEKERVEALLDIREANRDLELAIIDDVTTAELNRIEIRRQLGEAYSGEIAIAQADAEIAKLEEQIRLETDRFELTKLQYQLTQAAGNRRRAEIDLELEKLEEVLNLELNQIEIRRQLGEAYSSESAIAQADIEIEKLKTQIALETDRVKLSQLQLQLTQARGQKVQASTDLELEKLREAEAVELESLERKRRVSGVLAEELAVQEAVFSVSRIESQLALETDRVKKAELRLELVKAIGAVEDAELQKRLREIDLRNKKELTRFRTLINQKKMLQEEYDVAVAEQEIERIRQAIAVEKDRGNQIDLQLQLVEAQGQLIEANIRLYEAKLNKESLIYENTIKRQNQELDKQANQFEKLNRSLEMRSQLLDAQRSLFDAGQSYFIGELEAIASTTKSERKRKQIQEIIAATKLKSAITQAKFEERSLQISQQMRLLELDREEITKRIALNEARIAEQRAGAELKKAIRAGLPQEEIEARRIEVDLARQTTQLRQEDLDSVDEIRRLNAETFRMQTQAQQFGSEANIRAAQIAAAESITNRRQRSRAIQAIGQDAILEQGFGSVDELARTAPATSRAALRESGITGLGRAESLSAEERMRILRGESDVSGATIGAEREIRRLTGGMTQGFQQFSQASAPLKLPDYLTPKIDAVEFGKALGDQVKGEKSTVISPTFNIKIEGDKNAGQQIKKEVEPRLEAIVDGLVKMAR